MNIMNVIILETKSNEPSRLCGGKKEGVNHMKTLHIFPRLKILFILELENSRDNNKPYPNNIKLHHQNSENPASTLLSLAQSKFCCCHLTSSFKTAICIQTHPHVFNFNLFHN